MATRKRYKDIERVLTMILIGDAAVFLLYMIFAGLGIGWLKVITTIVNVVDSLQPVLRFCHKSSLNQICTYF